VIDPGSGTAATTGADSPSTETLDDTAALGVSSARC
jgi:hypothetical protein